MEGPEGGLERGMRLHPDTRVLVESLLREFVYTL